MKRKLVYSIVGGLVVTVGLGAASRLTQPGHTARGKCVGVALIEKNNQMVFARAWEDGSVEVCEFDYTVNSRWVDVPPK